MYENYDVIETILKKEEREAWELLEYARRYPYIDWEEEDEVQNVSVDKCEEFEF